MDGFSHETYSAISKPPALLDFSAFVFKSRAFISRPWPICVAMSVVNHPDRGEQHFCFSGQPLYEKSKDSPPTPAALPELVAFALRFVHINLESSWCISENSSSA